jgi:polysaccharide export outer membrane protein
MKRQATPLQVICLLAISASPMTLMSQVTTSSRPLMSQDSQAANLPLYAVGPNDLLNIAVYDSPELSGSIRVDTDGMIKLPMLQENLKVDGMLPSEIETALTQTLQREQLVVHPVVRVTVAEYQSRTIVVSGAVHKPTTFQAAGDVTLLDAITKADGLSDVAGDEILVETRKTKDSPGLMKRISVQALMDTAQNPDNFLLHGGEQIRVPEQGKIAVIGNVRHPGLFTVRQSQDGSVLRLIARSEGLSPNASAEAYIFHDASRSNEDTDGRINIHNILSQKSPDVQLHQGDILYVPDNTGRRVTLEILKSLMSAGSMASSALIYSSAR